jgi:hypothetical protein
MTCTYHCHLKDNYPLAKINQHLATMITKNFKMVPMVLEGAIPDMPETDVGEDSRTKLKNHRMLMTMTVVNVSKAIQMLRDNIVMQ